jgi:undecaprenyl pyrophosphate phosphatase UppP
MEDKISSTAKCKWCKTDLPIDHSGLCPKCGKTGKEIAIEVTEVIRVLDSINVKLLKKDKKDLPLSFIMSILGTILSIIIAILSTDFLKGVLYGWISIILAIVVFIAAIVFFIFMRSHKVERIDKLRKKENEFYRDIEEFLIGSLEKE